MNRWKEQQDNSIYTVVIAFARYSAKYTYTNTYMHHYIALVSLIGQLEHGTHIIQSTMVMITVM